MAPDRVISLTDPEMRHGHKSAANHFDGRKVQLATDAASRLVLAVEPTRIPVENGPPRPPVRQDRYRCRRGRNDDPVAELLQAASQAVSS